jgi:hypothetical protein
MPSTDVSRSGRRRARSEVLGSETTGTPNATPAAATRPIAVTAHSVTRQSAEPISVPAGSPERHGDAQPIHDRGERAAMALRRRRGTSPL